MWRFFIGVAAASSLCACSFDFGGLKSSDAGGAGGAALRTSAAGLVTIGAQTSGAMTSATTVAGSSTVSASVGQSTSASMASVSVSASSASSGSGGGTPLGPCGSITDDFATFPAAAWNVHPTASSDGGMAKLAINDNDNWAGVWQTTSAIDECYVTVELGMAPSNARVYLKIDDIANQSTISYSDSASHMLSVPSGQNVNLNGKPDALGFALTGGKIYYLYRSGGTWTVVDNDNRPSWMDAGEALGFGINFGTGGSTGKFDDFGLSVITKNDLGL